jgi:hypothetical protein
MRPLPLLTLLATLTFIGSAFFFPFQGYDEGQVPIPQPDPPVQPAGWAFSIWTLIYLGLFLSAAYGVWRRADDPLWDRVRLPLLLSLAIGTPWLAIAQRSAIWATVVIVLMAALAIAAMLRAPERDRWLLRAPVSLLAGWLTAASFVSLGSTLAGFGVMGAVAAAWLCVALAAATALAVQAAAGRAPAYAVSAGWALFAIAVKNAGDLNGLAILAALGAAAVAVVAWIGWRRGPRVTSGAW